MKSNLLIIGASGHGKVLADIALNMKRWKNIYFLDDDNDIDNSMGMKVIGKSINASEFISDFDIFIGIGNNVIRQKVQERLEEEGASIPVLIHPNAVIGEQVDISSGTVVMAGVVINCCSKIGKGCIINTGSTVDHDNIIEDFVHISPGAHLAGTVRVGQGAWLGIGSIISNNVSITSWSKVGAGATVLKDITETGTFIGVPARRL